MRIRMVTRTVKTYTVKAMVTDIIEASVKYQYVVITGECDLKTLTKKVKSKVEEEAGIVFTAIVDTEVEEKVYGMPEEEFMLYAKEVTR